MDADSGKNLCNEIGSCILSLAYGIALEILVVTVVFFIVSVISAVVICCFFCAIIKGDLYLGILFPDSEETAFASFGNDLDLSLFLSASEFGNCCLYRFVNCLSSSYPSCLFRNCFRLLSQELPFRTS